MPERQSSPGEVTARPETDGEQNGNGHHPEPRQDDPAGARAPEPTAQQATGPAGAAGAAPVANGPVGAGSPMTGSPITGSTVADQVADHVAAEPSAVEPGPAEPGDESPAADAPVADGVTIIDAADGPDPTADAARPAPVADPVPVSPPTPTPRPRTDGPAGDGPTVPVPADAATTATPAAAPVRRPTHDGQGTWFNTWDKEATQLIPHSATAGGTDVDAWSEPEDGANAEPPTELLATASAPPPTGPGGDPDGGPDDAGPPRARRRLLIVAGVLLLLAVLYGADLALSSGAVPRGVAVAGVPVGGLAFDEAEKRLRTEIEPRTTQPVAVTVGETRSEIDPRTAGLTVDWAATLDQAGSQPLNPITRVTSIFTEREVGVVTTTDRAALDAALAELAPIVEVAPVEGAVRFEGSTPVPVDPVPGQSLDTPGAAAILTRDWARGDTVALPLTALPTTTTHDEVLAAIADVAEPAVSGPLTVTGEGGTKATLTPENIADVLSFRADPAGGLIPEINMDGVVKILDPQLAASEQPARDAKLDFASGSAVVVPSQDGRGVDYQATLKDLLPVLTGDGPRTITAVYADQPAELTTDELNALGISGVIGEFTTHGFASDSGQNIKRAAEVINGMVVQPGATFSLNGATYPRDAAHGYVEAGIINEGHASRGVGGGVSQIATTTYNAAYFAGMVDVQHQEHSFYISRYPAGREATVFEGSIDLKFRNDNPTAVMIQTVWTPDSITVRLYGTKRYEVTSTPGPRTNPTSPNTVTIPAGQPCSASQGSPGFTITDTRTLREISTGQVRNETRTVRYNPAPIVICGA